MVTKKGTVGAFKGGPSSLSTRILTVFRVISRAKGKKGRDKKTARAGKSAYVERKVCVGGMQGSGWMLWPWHLHLLISLLTQAGGDT